LFAFALFVDFDRTNKGTARRMEKISPPILSALLCLLFLTAGSAASVPVGERAPDFALRALSGENLRLSEYRSEVVVLNFWASWCNRCSDAMPMLNSLFDQHQDDGLQVLAVGVDGQSHKALEFVNAAAVAFPMLLDNEQATVSRMYELGTMPLTVIIDREGNVRHVHTGFKKDSGTIIAAQVAQLLAE
jgi:peroxiredoxin